MMFEFAEEVERLANIKVAGIGGAGGNAVGRMIEAGLTGVEFLALNTDLQALKESPAHNAMQVGAQLTKGLGSGGDPATGEAAAEEDRERIAAALAGADMVFVTAGMGGGTGTGAAPIVAEIAREQGALTVGIVTRPFLFEGEVRMEQADAGIERLRDAVDTLIAIPNQRLLEVVPPHTSMHEAFRIADNVLYEATRGIYEIISRHDHVNLDFADVSAVMRGMGEAMMGTGRAEGENRAVEAAQAAISSPLLEDVDIAGSRAVLVNVLGAEVGLQDTAAAMQFIQEAAGPQAHVIFGYGLDETLANDLQVTVIATGFDGRATGRPAAEMRAARLEIPEPEIPEPESEAPPAVEPAELGFTSLEDAESESLLEAEAAAGATLDPEFPPEPVIESVPELAQPAASLVNEQPAAEVFTPPGPATTAAPEQPFLRRVGMCAIGEVEVPSAPDTGMPEPRGTAAGLRPELPGEDLSAPAYSRKYMD